MILEIARNAVDPKFIKNAAGLLARAFQDYPEYVQLLPDPEKRRRKLPVMFEIFTRFCVKNGIVFTTSMDEPLEGVLMYIPPPGVISSWGMIRNGALGIPFKIGFNFIRDELRIMNVVSGAKKTHATMPHAYLFLLAVNPAFQKQGFAAALMDHLLIALDKDNLGCYLETSAPGNVAFYRRYDFDLIEAIVVPGTGLTIHAMLRSPTKK